MNLKKTLKTLKMNENMISAVLGVIVIMVVGIIAINFFSNQKTGETIPPVEIEEASDLPAKHIVKAGENLWNISEQYYGSGYNWVDIANENKLTDPNGIEEGQELNIPDTQPKAFGEELTPTEKPQLAVASPKPSEAPSREAGKSVYKVEVGDSLWSIAEKHYNSGYNWVDIAQANNISHPDLIENGQEIVLPDVSPKLATVASATSEESGDSISGATYTVQEGDSLWGIALRAYGDGYRWGEISSENNLSNPGVIHPGNVLRLKR